MYIKCNLMFKYIFKTSYFDEYKIISLILSKKIGR